MACRYRHEGRTRKFTIGSYPALSLSAARDLAKDALVSVAKGIDPYEVKKAAKAPPDHDIVQKVVDTFIERHAKPNTRPATALETERSLKREVVDRWKNRRLSSITRADVLAMLDEIVDRGSPIAANRLLATFRKCCAWAIERGLIETSPCAGITQPAANRTRDRVLSDVELRRVWLGADKLAYPFGDMVKLLILTGARRDEVAGLTWIELHIEAKSWRLPRERAKNNSEHDIPLSPLAISVLNTLPRLGSSPHFLFTTNMRSHVSGYSKSKIALDKIIGGDGDGPIPHWTFHDIRRSVATGLARLGINLPVIERILNHVSGSFAGIVGTYQRHSFAEEKRIALNAWGEFVEHLVAGEPMKVPQDVRATSS